MLELIKPFNFIIACDSYKLNHYLEIPAGAQYALASIVPRKASKFSPEIVNAGITLLTFVLSRVRITYDMIDEAEIEANEQGYTFNRAGWEIIVEEFDGKLPLTIYGVEEGRVVNPQTPIVSVINSDPRFVWLPGDIETFAQGGMWKMSTVATTCRAAKKILAAAIIKTGADMGMLDYKLHNFGDRGADGFDEPAVIAGISHAMLFRGSDCTRANGYIKVLYKTKKAYTSSVEATEHSTMCMNSNAETKDDFGAVKMVVERLHAVVARAKAGIGIPVMSAVIDTYDARRFVREYTGGIFKDEIINSGGVLTHRPDSGNPCEEPANVGRDIEATFGAEMNNAGYKRIHPATGVLQGDGVRIETLPGIIAGWVDGGGFSMDGFLLGMGGGVTHEGSRDTFSFSMKATAYSTDGKKWTRLLKEPKTDIGKKSLSGLVRCFENDDGTLSVIDCTDTPERFFEEGAGHRLWLNNGDRLFVQNFDDVMARASAGIL